MTDDWRSTLADFRQQLAADEPQPDHVRLPRPRARKYPCPTCDATAGQRCLWPFGAGHRRSDRVHPDRYGAAWAAGERYAWGDQT